MVAKTKQPKHSERALVIFSKVGEVLKTIATSHPAVLGLMIMAGCAVTLAISRKQASEGSKWGTFIAAEADGLYQGAKGLAFAAAVVPAIVAVAGAATGVAGALTPKPAPQASALPPPPTPFTD